MKKVYTFLSVLCCSVLLWTSCTNKKDLPPLPEDKILEYKVANLRDGVAIYGAIDNQKNTITVYVPFYYGLLVIDPEIKLSDGAKLSEEVLPVNLETEGHTYTVLGADGSRRTYTLHIHLQTTPSFEVAWGTNAKNIAPYHTMPYIVGNFAHNNAQTVSVTLINQETQQRFPVSTARSTISNHSHLRFGSETVPADIVEGSYLCEVKNIGHTTFIEEPLTIQYIQPDVYLSQSLITLRKSSPWEIIPLNSVFLDPVKVTATIGEAVYELSIDNWNRTAMRVSFPADFPTGQLENVSMHFEFKGWESITKIVQLNITE